MESLLAKPGQWGDAAAHFLMKLLYAARMCRPDLLVAITRLASRIVTWDADCDRRLKRIYDYLQCHADISLRGCLGPLHAESLEIHVWPDADLAGDQMNTKSSSGRFIELAASDGSTFPVAWSYQKQGHTSTSTPEAETVSLAAAVKEAIPIQQLVSLLIGRPVKMRVFEDNEGCIACVQKGYTPTMRHIGRVHRTSIGMLHEIFEGRSLDEYGGATLEYSPSKTHKGDPFTKELSPMLFKSAVDLIGMCIADVFRGECEMYRRKTSTFAHPEDTPHKKDVCMFSGAQQSATKLTGPPLSP